MICTVGPKSLKGVSLVCVSELAPYLGWTFVTHQRDADFDRQATGHLVCNNRALYRAGLLLCIWLTGCSALIR
ncbi:hypothetical protein EDD17DRAFT_1622283 [Pisolithus thermaeus]|nr:hypothetical protein EDD17DRAFT_1622283 [Pisolithus thermaeus]